MEDDSLDDFFAKKDKSKKKNKGSKFNSSDIMSKQKGGKSGSKSSTSVSQNQTSSSGSGDVGSKKKNKDSDSKSQPAGQSNSASGGSHTGGFGVNTEEDEQWEDFKEETEKDYSGLRIQNLQISSREEEEEQENEVEEGDEEGEGGDKKAVQQGPWAGPVPTPAPPPPPPSEEPEPPKKEEAPKSTGKYVPPGARQAALASSASSGGGGGGSSWRDRRAGKKEAPNIQSEIDFPTLGGATHPELQKLERDKTGGKFEAVRSGNRQEVDRSQQSHIELGNKFDALRGGNPY